MFHNFDYLSTKVIFDFSYSANHDLLESTVMVTSLIPWMLADSDVRRLALIFLFRGRLLLPLELRHMRSLRMEATSIFCFLSLFSKFSSSQLPSCSFGDFEMPEL